MTHDTITINSPLQVYTLVIGTILLFFSLSTLIILTYSLYKENTSKTPNGPKIKISQLPTILSGSFYWCSCCIFIAIIFALHPGSNENFSTNTDFVFCLVLFVICIFLAKLSMYAHFLVRLYASFKDSVLQINRSTIIASICLFCVQLIVLTWWIILIILNVSRQHQSDSYNTQLYMIVFCLILFDLCLSYMVVGLFINKLFRFLLFKDRSGFLRRAENKLISQRRPQGNGLVADDSDDDEKKHDIDEDFAMTKTYSFVLDIVAAGIDDSDMKTLDLITKEFILSIKCMVTTQFVYGTLIILLAAKDTQYVNEHYMGIYWLFGGVYYPMEVIMNCAVLYFNYKFAAKYYKWCCWICHKRCKQCAIRHAAKRIYKQYYQDLTLRHDN